MQNILLSRHLRRPEKLSLWQRVRRLLLGTASGTEERRAATRLDYNRSQARLRAAQCRLRLLLKRKTGD